LGGKASLGALARRFGVRESTIEKWREQALESVQQAMRQGDARSGRERELEKELKALREAFTDLAIRHELRERAIKDRPTPPGRSSR
jgi:transposase-like protein